MSTTIRSRVRTTLLLGVPLVAGIVGLCLTPIQPAIGEELPAGSDVVASSTSDASSATSETTAPAASPAGPSDTSAADPATPVASSSSDASSTPAAATPDASPSTTATVAAPTGPQGPFLLALWISTDASGGQWPQRIVKTTSVDTLDIHALDTFATCGTYQADLYAMDLVSARLVAGGHLDGPGNPAESWPGGSYDSSYSRVFTATSGCAHVEPCTAFGPTVTRAQDASNALPAPWITSDTRANGHNVITAAGLHVYTDDSSSLAKAAGYYPVDIPLANAGTPALTFASKTGTAPGFQLVLDSGRILVGESDYYGNRFWSKTAQQGVPAADGYPASAPLDTWLQALPTAHVRYIGYSLGSGVKGDSTIAALGLGGGCQITFAPFVPLPEPVVTHASSSSVDCASSTYTEDRTTTTTAYVRDANGQPILGQPVTKHDAGYPATRPATSDELAGASCPVVTPPAPPSSDTPEPASHITAATPTADRLAYTGLDAMTALLTVLVLVAAGAALIAAARIRNRTPRYRRTRA